MKHTGSCYCGKIEFSIETEFKEAVRCNCSICSKRGYLFAFAGRDQIVLKTPETNHTNYTFNKHHISHYFCNHSGCSPFIENLDSSSGKPPVAINLNCLDSMTREEISTLPVVEYDGRHS